MKRKMEVIKILVLLLLVQWCVLAVSAATISFGETVVSTINTPGETDSYTFDAVAGDAIYARMASSWLYYPKIWLYAPNGTSIATSGSYNDMNNVFTAVDSTGTYTIIVGDGATGEDTGTYGLFVQRTNNAGTAEPIGFGETRTGSLSRRGEMKSYTFDAYSGDQIFLRLASSWQYFPRIWLYAPNGTNIAMSGSYNDVNSITALLNSTGTFTIVVGDGATGEDTGTYSLSLQFVGSQRTIANFSANTTFGVLPLAVQFTDASTNSPIAWSWDFGDGNTSTQKNASNIYASPGYYNVTLTATNSYGSNTTTKKNYIWVTARKTTKISIFRPSTGYWYFDNNLDGSYDKSFRFGGSTDQIVKGDWNGDGTDGVALFRPSTGYWYFDNNLDGVYDKTFRYGNPTDQIVVGDWDGNGRDGIALFRASTGYWYFDYNLDSIVNKSFRFGGSADQIVKGDWLGMGSDGIALFRNSTGNWYFDNNLDGIYDKTFRYGNPTDRIVVGDWDGDGNDGIALFRPSTGYWYFDYNLDGIVNKSFRYGNPTDRIVVGDWDGDGKDGIAVFRPSTGYWYFDYNLDGAVNKSFRFGNSGDQIIVGTWA